ncbi:MAG: GPW/gp25 family protein [Planctomycetota bacterium]
MTDPIKGLSLPFRIDPASGGVQSATGDQKIKMNLRSLLGTRHGERPMLRDFGSRIHSLVHELNDPALARSITKHLQESLLGWERRVFVTDTATQSIEGQLHVVLRYRYVDTQEEQEVAIPVA